MNFVTKAEFEENPVKIHHKERILTIGSCFAEHIGQKLVENKFNTLCNPFGIVYNPQSVTSCLKRLYTNSYINTKELQLCQDYYCHPDFHSQFNGIDKQATLQGINNQIREANAFANEGLDWLFISLGTAFVFHQKSDQRIVNNCHKLPANQFDRRLSTSSEAVTAISSYIDQLRKNNPSLKVILTVSPIRHVRDGLSDNLRSKSRLIEAAHALTEKLDQCYYFPSYEILIEELRDYRWFKKDMIHPSDQAIDIIWERFKDFGIDQDGLKLIEKMNSLHKNLNHKAFLAASSQYQKFLSNTESKISELEKEYDHIDFELEKSTLVKLKESSDG